MVSSMLKIIVTIFCINIFMYLGVNYAMENTEGATSPTAVRIEGDLFDILLQDRGQFDEDMDDYVRSFRGEDNLSRGYSFNMSGNINRGLIPDFETGADVQESSGGIPFIDALKTIRAFAATLFNIALSPLTLFTHNGIPPLIAVMIAMPLFLIELTILIIFLRGGGAT